MGLSVMRLPMNAIRKLTATVWAVRLGERKAIDDWREGILQRLNAITKRCCVREGSIPALELPREISFEAQVYAAPRVISTRKTLALSNSMARTLPPLKPSLWASQAISHIERCRVPTTNHRARNAAAVYDAGQTRNSMTYMLNSKQYIVVAIGGQNYPSESVAFRLFN